MSTFRWLLSALLLPLAVACTPAGEPAAAPEGGGARTFRNADGSVTEIPAPPQRILSTSVAITGTLLAIDAPVVASGSAADGTFFGQWREVAAERGVQNVWSAGSVDLEAAYAVRPDLIVVATAGADSAIEQLAELRAIAPTILLDYGSQTWQALARQLGEATSREAAVEARIAEFDAYVDAARAKIAVPEGETNIISYNGPGAPNPIAQPDGVHGRLLGALGFRIEAPDPAWHVGTGGPRGDFVWAQYEQLSRLRAQTTFLIWAGDARAQAFMDDPVLANLPSVRARRVYALGEDSFRIDYYSATAIVDRIVARFGK
ncbi:Fe2+-enterobactin ABC transporter substrate-binding protein [Luteimonas huabeiensis]|uniref:Fe2+-enterobactin ABC transporter substrate-binding protein n=1 Tax=Luteimonas huabeiensis TaxID=1244513 RepID=UPI00046793E6|nr:Fe2+-enterobactin ABC transporter substrate-binding protein [Luteimonas huabeiensis]